MAEQKFSPELIPYGLVVPIVTPLDKYKRRLTNDEPSLNRLIEHLTPFADWLFVGGTAGEFDHMPIWARIMLFQQVANSAPDRFRRIANVSASTIPDLEMYTKSAHKTRFHGVSVNLLYGEGSPSLKLASVCEHTDKPITIYEIPEKQKGKTLDPKIYGPLFVAHPQIVAIKVSAKDPEVYRQWTSFVPQGLAVLSGSVTHAEAAINNGATGIVPITANVTPEIFEWDHLTNEEGLADPMAMKQALAARQKYDGIEDVKSELVRMGIIHRSLMYSI